MKISIKDSTENFNENTIEQVWFFTLDSVFEIKRYYIKMFKALKDKKSKRMAQLSDKELEEITSLDDQAEEKAKYEKCIKVLDQFLQSRIDYVIENTLAYVELDMFLDHINQKVKNTKIHELHDLFESIFSERKSEFIVASHAYKSAK